MFTRQFPPVWRFVALGIILILLTPLTVTAQGNCNLNSSDRPSDWKNWDSYIERLRSRNCEFVDIDVQMLATGTPSGVGDRFSYVIVVTNLGTTEAMQVEILDFIPGELLFDLLTLQIDFGSSSGGCSASTISNDLSCQLSSLPAGSSINISFEVELKLLRDFSNTVNLITASDDLDPRNNSATVTTVID